MSPTVKWMHLAIALFLGLFFASCQTSEIPKGVLVQVHRVVSGQTVEVSNPQGDSPFQVRLIGIEAPNLQQLPWGTAAKQQLEQWVGGQSVLLEFDVESRDGFHRRLAYLWLNGMLVNEELVKEGLTLESARSPNVKYQRRLARAQDWARLMGKGIWNPENPLRQTPTAFRRQNQRSGGNSKQEKPNF